LATIFIRMPLTELADVSSAARAKPFEHRRHRRQWPAHHRWHQTGEVPGARLRAGCPKASGASMHSRCRLA
jgi:hypothetical protein